jgi:hypothetical protein
MVPLTPTKFVMANQTAREDAKEPNFSTASRKGQEITVTVLHPAEDRSFGFNEVIQQ